MPSPDRSAEPVREQRLLGPWLVLPVGTVAALLAVVLAQVRLGGYLLATTFAVTSLLRLALPTRMVGALAARSRTTDVLGLGVAAAAAAVLTWTLKLTG